ncbi:MAG: alcohol dehydrogenase catalytic domain-containing protein [Thaumarchaeota archaeon]|nr:alcohol dehydrogenase catalytic domain-containing protein [Nitrososphaerota archaeon]
MSFSIVEKSNMKAARFHSKTRLLSVDDVDLPQISSNEVLLKVRAAGVCHTELHFLDGMIPISGEAMTLGHEISGEVSKVGSEVTNVRPGDRVIVNNCVPCNNCMQCFEGRENLCDNIQQLGFTIDGGFAEFVKVRSDLVVSLPQSVSFEQGAALTCGSATCYHALFDVGNLTSKDTMLINGTGGVGFSALQIAKNAGAACIAVDVVDEKLDLAKKEFGADYTINGKKENVAEKVKELTRGKGVDILLEFVGIPATMKYSMDVLSKKGRIVFVGYTSADYVVSPLNMILKEASVLSAIAYRKSNLIAVRDLTERGKLRPLVTGRYQLSQIDEPLNQLRNGTAIGRSVLVF